MYRNVSCVYALFIYLIPGVWQAGPRRRGFCWSTWLHGCWMWISPASPVSFLALVQICMWQEPFGQHRISDRFEGPFLVFCLWTIWHVNLTDPCAGWGGKNDCGDCCCWPCSEIEQGQGVRLSFTAQTSGKWSSASLLVLHSVGSEAFPHYCRGIVFVHSLDYLDFLCQSMKGCRLTQGLIPIADVCPFEFCIATFPLTFCSYVLFMPWCFNSLESTRWLNYNHSNVTLTLVAFSMPIH